MDRTHQWNRQQVPTTEIWIKIHHSRPMSTSWTRNSCQCPHTHPTESHPRLKEFLLHTKVYTIQCNPNSKTLFALVTVIKATQSPGRIRDRLQRTNRTHIAPITYARTPPDSKESWPKHAKSSTWSTLTPATGKNSPTCTRRAKVPTNQ